MSEGQPGKCEWPDCCGGDPRGCYQPNELREQVDLLQRELRLTRDERIKRLHRALVAVLIPLAEVQVHGIASGVRPELVAKATEGIEAVRKIMHGEDD